MPSTSRPERADDRRRRAGSRPIAYGSMPSSPGCLIGRILRSPYPHARVLASIRPAPRALPGVLAVLSRNDLLDKAELLPYYGPVIRDQPIVAMDKVRFVGDRVAAVAAVDEDTAAGGAGRHRGRVRGAAGRLRARQALGPSAADPARISGPHSAARTFADIVLNTAEGTNRLNHFKLRKGDVDEGFAGPTISSSTCSAAPRCSTCRSRPTSPWPRSRAGKVTVWAAPSRPTRPGAAGRRFFTSPLAQSARHRPHARRRLRREVLPQARAARSPARLESPPPGEDRPHRARKTS